MTVSAAEPPGGRAGCPQCGFEWKGDSDEDGAAQRRIEELEAQIRGLNEKAIETGMCDGSLCGSLPRIAGAFKKKS